MPVFTPSKQTTQLTRYWNVQTTWLYTRLRKTQQPDISLDMCYGNFTYNT
jgi:hypothetical protein